MALYRVTTQRTGLKVHADHHLDSKWLADLPRGSLVEVIDFHGRWMKCKMWAYSADGPWNILPVPGWAYSGDDRPFLARDDGTPAASPPPAPKHLLIFFGGASPGQRPGADLTPGTSAARVCRDILSWNLFENSIAKDPAVNNSSYNDAINPVIDYLHRLPDSDRVGSVVIYGFSAGGFNALRLCQRISEEITDIPGLPTGDRGLPRRINLLITIDPCIQDAPGLPPPPHWFEGLDRKAPPIVERHINYHQSQDPDLQGDDGHYHGCPMRGVGNHDLRGTPHDAMPPNTLPFLMQPIRQSVSSNVDAWF